MSRYESVIKRLEYLESKESPLYYKNRKDGDLCPYNAILYLKHSDKSEFTWWGCYHELYEYEVEVPEYRRDKAHNLSEYEIPARPPMEIVKTIIVIPEHHKPVWYDLEDIEKVEEITHRYEEVRKLIWEEVD